jgi:hypothetical protein
MESVNGTIGQCDRIEVQSSAVYLPKGEQIYELIAAYFSISGKYTAVCPLIPLFKVNTQSSSVQ